MAWQSLRASLEPEARVFYRHRHRNIGRKSGNIQDFCENWGAHYDYMVVLDADSLMSGETLAALVRLMDANPRAALIQAPATLVGRSTLFARIQQFGSSAYGPTYNAGPGLAARRATAITGATMPSSACAPSSSMADCRSCPASRLSAARS